MSTTVGTPVLQSRFARALPEMAVPWQAEEAPAPSLLALDEDLADELGLDPQWLRTEDGVRFLLGADLPTGAAPVAQAYAGHQFGSWVPRLGDGRALLLGELVDRQGRLRDLHLKGSGRTPFARGGDGRAVVGPMLREHVVSRAMHALGIPTTRSLAVLGTGRLVRRETALPGAVLARTASSHLRVGSVQYARATGDLDLLRRVADLAVERHHPEAAAAERPHLALYEAVVAAQARLVAQWMLVGFVHGVMNTDNVTLSGETIDYGPCAFIDAFDPSAVFSSIDAGGRYAYANQPALAQWDLARLAEALLPLLDEDEARAVELAQGALEGFAPVHRRAWSDGMRAKLGLTSSVGDADADPVVEELLQLLQGSAADWTSTFRSLAAAARDADGGPAGARALELLGGTEEARAWLGRWRGLRPDAGAMDRTNPVYVPRNHLVEEALAAATAGDLGPFERLLEAVSSPFDERVGLERHAEPGPAGAVPYVTFCGT